MYRLVTNICTVYRCVSSSKLTYNFVGRVIELSADEPLRRRRGHLRETLVIKIDRGQAFRLPALSVTPPTVPISPARRDSVEFPTLPASPCRRSWHIQLHRLQAANLPSRFRL